MEKIVRNVVGDFNQPEKKEFVKKFHDDVIGLPEDEPVMKGKQGEISLY